MQHPFRWLSPLLVLVLAGSVGAAEPKKTTKPTTKEKILTSGYLEGKLTVVEISTKNFTVQVEYPEYDQNKVQALKIYRIQAARDIAATTNLADKRNKIASYQVEIAKREADLIHKVTKDIKCASADNMKVRQKHLPPVYDDKGRPRKYTKAELKELKGPNKNLAGYVASFDNLRPNQKVRVYLGKQKKKSKSKDDKDSDLLEKRLKAVMVLILEEPPGK
jgi:hypothetical protein